MKKLTHLQRLQSLLEKIVDKFDDMVRPVKVIPHKFSRSLAFAKIGYNSHDFDDYYLVELEVFKLKRMLYLFENHGHHCPTCDTYIPKMKSIKLAIKLGEKWLNSDYFRFWDLHNKKYGDTEIGWESIPNSTNSLMITLKDGKKYERSEEERKSLIDSHRKDEREKEKHRQLFYKIIAKYGRYYWD
jgi:hypothetical protein